MDFEDAVWELSEWASKTFDPCGRAWRISDEHNLALYMGRDQIYQVTKEALEALMWRQTTPEAQKAAVEAAVADPLKAKLFDEDYVVPIVRPDNFDEAYELICAWLDQVPAEKGLKSQAAEVQRVIYLACEVVDPEFLAEVGLDSFDVRDVLSRTKYTEADKAFNADRLPELVESGRR